MQPHNNRHNTRNKSCKGKIPNLSRLQGKGEIKSKRAQIEISNDEELQLIAKKGLLVAACEEMDKEFANYVDVVEKQDDMKLVKEANTLKNKSKEKQRH